MKKKISYIVTVIGFLVLIIYVTPLGFVKDGVLTRQKVDSYQTQYDLGSTNRHRYDLENIYLFYIGFQDVKVQSEQYRKARDVELEKIGPFLYRWKWTKESAFRVSIGENKYYFTIVHT